MTTALPRGGPVKKGTWAEWHHRHYGPKYKPRPLVRPRPCPYRGLMAAGWRAYFAGKPRPHRGMGPGRADRGKAWAFFNGWTKARLAHEQRKPAL